MICLAPTGKVKRFSLPDLMKPREFCREWLRASPEDEQERGYKERCAELLAEITGVGKEAVIKWGKSNKTQKIQEGEGINFPLMPEQYEKTLAYALTLKRIAEAVYTGSPRVVEIVMAQLQSRDPDRNPE